MNCYMRLLFFTMLTAFFLSCAEKVKQQPLLLDEPPGANKSSGTAAIEADNSRCHVCHLNYAFDDLAVKHAQVNR